MYKLRVNISSITRLRSIPVSGAPLRGLSVYDAVNRMKAAPWAEVLELLQEDTNESIFSMQLYAIDDVDIDEQEYTYGYQGVPINLKDDMIIVGDELVDSNTIVTSKPLEDPFTDPAQIVTAQPTAAEQAVKRAAEFIDTHAILDKREAFNPSTIFKANEIEEMIKYHGGIDVTTPYNLLSWQKLVLSRVTANDDFTTIRAPLKDAAKAVRTDV